MPVEVDRDLGPEPAAHRADEVLDRLRRRDPERVHDHGLLRARLDRRLVGPLEEHGVGARSVDAEVGDGDPGGHGERDGAANPLEHLVARDAERLELEVGDRRFDHAGGDA